MKTTEKLAEQHKASPKTIQRDATFAQHVDQLAEALGPEVRQQICPASRG